MSDRSTALLLLAFFASSAALAAECTPIASSEGLLEAGSVVLLGEIHGTAEAPATLGRLACEAARRGLPVAVALEIPTEEQDRIEAFTGGETSRSDLLSGPFWQRAYQDGRSSRAMADLLEELRRLRLESPSLRVVAIDEPDPPAARDQAMARRVDELAEATPNGLVLVLTGNLHSRLTRGTRFDPNQEPMGFLLRQRRPETKINAINLTREGGSAWICTGPSVTDCGERRLRGERQDPGVHYRLRQADDPFTGWLNLGPISASPPATGGEPRPSRGPDASPQR